MSLITLRSTQHQNGSTLSESAALISNFFKEGIPLHPGNTLELVSMSITKLEKFEIITGQNDTFIWRLGSGPSSVGAVPNFSQHQVTLPAGSYNGADLAFTLQTTLNNSTLLGNYRGQWAVTFTSATTSGAGGLGTNAKFTINYGQNVLPASNGEKLVLNVLGGGNNPTITSEPNHKLITWATTDNDVGALGNINNGFYGDRSLYPNGGEFEIHIAPVQDLSGVNFTTQQNTITNWETASSGPVDVLTTWTEPGALPNDWTYQIEVPDGEDDAINTFIEPPDHGALDTATIVAVGTGYGVGDTGNLVSDGFGLGGTYLINSVDGAGGILSFSIQNNGGGYQVGDALDFASGAGVDGTATAATITGTGGTGYAVDNEGGLIGGSGSSGTYKVLTETAGVVQTVEILNPGQDYVVGDILTLDGHGGNDAKILVLTTVVGANTYFAAIAPHGLLAFATTTDDTALDPNSWDIGKLKYNPSSNIYQATTTGGGGSFLQNATLRNGGDGTDGSGGPFTPVLTNFAYPEGRYGRSRDELIQGITLYPGNPDARINSTQLGQDISIHIMNNDVFSDIQIQAHGFIKAGGIDYPLPNWRTVKNFTPVVSSSNWVSLSQSPPNWTTFTYATDHIRLRIVQYGVRNNRIYISHDVAGNQAWTEEVLLLQTADENSGVTFTSTVRERLYPFCPTAFISRGSRFQAASYKFFGVFDTERIANVPGILSSTNQNGDEHESSEESEAGLQDYTGHDPLGAPAANLALGYIAKAGIVDASDIYDGPDSGAGANQISNRSVNPNIANINFILGLETAYTFSSGNETNTISTADISSPLTSIQEPSLHVELPDFNIRSYSGESGDTGRAVAVIPKEQWTTDSKTGTLQYVAPYPIPIDLNIPHNMVTNEINARLRQPSGEIANDLINPTEICLRLTESDESKQQRVMNNAMRQMSSFQSNIQDAKISNFNNNMPKI